MSLMSRCFPELQSGDSGAEERHAPPIHSLSVLEEEMHRCLTSAGVK